MNIPEVGIKIEIQPPWRREEDVPSNSAGFRSMSEDAYFHIYDETNTDYGNLPVNLIISSEESRILNKYPNSNCEKRYRSMICNISKQSDTQLEDWKEMYTAIRIEDKTLLIIYHASSEIYDKYEDQIEQMIASIDLL